MELLQKLTLYDLFGYTVPGVLAVWLYEYNEGVEHFFGESVYSGCPGICGRCIDNRDCGIA